MSHYFWICLDRNERLGWLVYTKVNICVLFQTRVYWIYCHRTKWHCTRNIKKYNVFIKWKKVKRSCNKNKSLYFGGNNNRVKKPCVENGRLCLREGQKCGAFGAIAALLIPSLIGPIAQLFGRKKRIKGKRKKKKRIK